MFKPAHEVVALLKHTLNEGSPESSLPLVFNYNHMLIHHRSQEQQIALPAVCADQTKSVADDEGREAANSSPVLSENSAECGRQIHSFHFWEICWLRTLCQTGGLFLRCPAHCHLSCSVCPCPTWQPPAIHVTLCKHWNCARVHTHARTRTHWGDKGRRGRAVVSVWKLKGLLWARAAEEAEGI